MKSESETRAPSLLLTMSLCLILLTLSPARVSADPGAILTASFSIDEDGFTYVSDAFATASASGYDRGDWTPHEGHHLSGGLQVALGGVNDTSVNDISGGWQQTFTLTEDTADVRVWFRYNLAQTGYYEDTEYTQVRASFDAAALGAPCSGGSTCVDELVGDGQTTTASIRTGWQVFGADLGILAAGDHTLLLGGYNNGKTLQNESSAVVFDDVLIASGNAPPVADAGRDRSVADTGAPGAESVELDGSASIDYDGTITAYDWYDGATLIGSGVNPTVDLSTGVHTLTLTVTDDGGETGSDSFVMTVCDWSDPAQALVCSLDYDSYRADILTLNNFGDRCRYPFSDCVYPSDSYQNAQNWIEGELVALGYAPQRHNFTTSAGARSNLYATKVGTLHPEQIYIISAHLDGRGGGGANDDNGSGSALVLAAARAFALPNVETDVSVRFIWWDQEERGISGSREYANDPPPPLDRSNWLGMIAHDMVLFDHRVPAEPNQNPSADLDVEYRPGYAFSSQSSDFVDAMVAGAAAYNDNYPAEAGDYSIYTDDTGFWDYCPAISVRENRRYYEIGLISGQPRIHPYYHTDQDLYENYTDADYLLGLNAVQMTVGSIAGLAGTSFLDPTAVQLAAFAAEAVGDGVLLTWETSSEVDLAGFHLFRAEVPEGDRIRLNADLIPLKSPPGAMLGAGYDYLDDTVEAGYVYDYWLESVALDGKTGRTGPARAAFPGQWRALMPVQFGQLPTSR